MDLFEAEHQLFARLCDARKGAFLLEGPAFVGKTELLKRLQRNLRASGPEDLAPLLFTCCGQHGGYEPILDALEHLSQRKNWVVRKQAGMVARWTGFYGLLGLLHAGGIVFPDLLTKDVLKGLRDALDSSVATSSQNSRLEHFPRSDADQLCKYLNEAIHKSGRRLILFVDRLDELPTPGINLLQYVADSSPDNFVLVLSASTDGYFYRARHDIRQLANTCKRKGNHAVIPLSGFSAESLRKIRNENGHVTDIDLANRAHDFSDGRIGLIHTWLNSPDDNAIELQSVADAIAAHYDIQFERLTEPQQVFIKALAAVYPDGVSLDAAAAILEKPIATLENELLALGPLAEHTDSTVSLKSPLVLYFVRKRAPGAVIQACYAELSAKVAAAFGGQNSSRLGGPLRSPQLLIPTALPSMNLQDAITAINGHLARGAAKAAIDYANAWRGWQSGPNETPSQLVMLEADACGQLGIYEQAIEKLLQVSLDFNVALSLGEKYHRLNRYKQALFQLRYARRESRAAGNNDVWMTAVCRTLSVSNDLGWYLRSRRLAQQLLKSLPPVDNGGRGLGLVYRTLARTFALCAETQVAIEFAQKALATAVSVPDQTRAEGNARYAFGDVLRHARRYDEAIEQYNLAYNIGEQTGNYDLKIYSSLGRAAAHLQHGNSAELLEEAAHLKSVVTPESPEACLSGLFQQAALKLNADATLENNAPIDITAISARPWVAKLARQLNEPATAFPAFIQSLVIAL